MLASPLLRHTARAPKERNIISLRRCRCEVSSFCLIFIKIWTGSIDFNLKNPKQNFTKIRPLGVETFHADTRMGVRTDMTQLNLALHTAHLRQECHSSKFDIS